MLPLESLLEEALLLLNPAVGSLDELSDDRWECDRLEEERCERALLSNGFPDKPSPAGTDTSFWSWDGAECGDLCDDRWLLSSSIAGLPEERWLPSIPPPRLEELDR